MRKVIVFNHVSLDGYFVDTKGDMSWAHKSDPEWDAFASENAKGGGSLLFGRVTYEMMASFWPTPMAAQMLPEVAKGMNAMEKFVFSRTLDTVAWSNTKLLKGNLIEEVTELKKGAGDGIVILGSGSIVAQLSEHRLIDEYQLVMNPLVLGAGRTLFEGLKHKLSLSRTGVRMFQNGNIVLNYEPSS